MYVPRQFISPPGNVKGVKTGCLAYPPGYTHVIFRAGIGSLRDVHLQRGADVLHARCISHIFVGWSWTLFTGP